MSAPDDRTVVSRSSPAFARPSPGAAPSSAMHRRVALARHAARELLYRTELDGALVDEVVMGQVVPSVLTPNVAREVSLLPQFPRTIPAYTLNRACASAAQAITNAADQISLGHADVIIAGGVESLSDIPMLHSPPVQPAPGRGEQGEDAGRAARHLRAGAPA